MSITLNPLTYREDDEPRAQHSSSVTISSPYCSGRPRNPPYKLLFISATCAFVGFIIGAYVQRSEPIIPSTASSRFELNKTFIEAPSPKTNAAWSSLVPLGRGFIVVDSSEKPVPYAGDSAELSNIRSVSVFHQIHCLVCRPEQRDYLIVTYKSRDKNELRIGYYAHHLPRTEKASTKDDASHHHSPAHMKHCFDYLRQALMCAADKTLERLQSDDGGNIASVDGWGTIHQCQDFQAVYDWTKSYRASGDGGIL